MTVKILRQQFPNSEPYFEEFDYDGAKDISVAALLDYINYNDDIVTTEGKKTTRIGWECSCLQGVCGACAIVINNVPALACETFLKDLKGDKITIRPLRKFPVVHDLLVDRSSIQENLKKTNVFIGEYNVPNDKEGKKHSQHVKEHEIQYLAAKCLKCGLCMEVCPNYINGMNFFGAAFANDCYSEYFGKSCSKSLSCMNVCPVGIPMISTISKLNR